LDARAVTKYLRISPRKLRYVIDYVRTKPVNNAMLELRTMTRKGARMAEKTIASAAANAEVLKMDAERLYIADIRADAGPVFKRFRPRSMGRADRILKRTSHLSVILREGAKKKQPKVEVEEKPAKKTRKPTAKTAAKAGKTTAKKKAAAKA